MVALELEVLAKKYDRFGWDRDRNTPAHDRIVRDWMDALQDYPLDEVKEACRRMVLESPKHMPNEGHVISQLRVIRREKADRFKESTPPKLEPKRERVTADAADAILAEAGIKPRRMEQGQ